MKKNFILFSFDKDISKNKNKLKIEYLFNSDLIYNN
jgi:hypothetical protein